MGRQPRAARSGAASRPLKDAWSLPGGLIELGETAEQALRREVLEECSIAVEIGDLLGIFEPVFREADGRIRYHYVVIDFLAYYRGGQLAVGDDAADARWVSPDVLAEYSLSPATSEMIGRALARCVRSLTPESERNRARDSARRRAPDHRGRRDGGLCAAGRDRPDAGAGDAGESGAARAAVEQFVAEGRIVYGITTGFGAFKDQLIPPDQVRELQRNIVMSHAVGVGAPFETPVVRAMMLIRANTLAKGYSGIRPEMLDLLLRHARARRPSHRAAPGLAGRIGDLAPLAHMALVMIGLGEAEFGGQAHARRRGVGAAGLAPGRAGRQRRAGADQRHGADGCAGLSGRDRGGERRGRGRYRRRAEPGGAARHAVGLRRAPPRRPPASRARWIAPLHAPPAGRLHLRCAPPTTPIVQDAYTLRCIPQVHGACHDAIKYTRWVVEIELNSATDNPLIFCEGDDSPSRSAAATSTASRWRSRSTTWAWA